MYFYSLPEYPHFYSEFVDMLESPKTLAEKLRQRQTMQRQKIDKEMAILQQKIERQENRKQKKALERKLAALQQETVAGHSVAEVELMKPTVHALCTPYEQRALERIVGHKRATHMIKSGKTVFMFHT